MHKSVVYQTGVNAQLAAHYETCIQEMKRKRKRSNRNSRTFEVEVSKGTSFSVVSSSEKTACVV